MKIGILNVQRRKNIKYTDPSKVCPYSKGLQNIESVQSNLIKTADEPVGYCSAWSMFFTELSLKNPEIPSSTLLNYVYEKFQNMTAVEQGNYLRSIIRGYSIFIDEKIEKYFSIFFSSGLTLEKLNNFTNVQLNELHNILTFLINVEINLAINPTYINDILKDIDLELEDKNVKLAEETTADALKKQIIKDQIEFLIQNKNKIQNYKNFNAISNTPPTYTPTPTNPAISDTPPTYTPAPTNPCPEGKVLNPITGRCIKDKTIKNKTQPNKSQPNKSQSQNKTKKECPEGKVLNPKTGRCIKDKTQPNKTQPQNKTKKECPEGKVLNPKTGRCIKDKTQPNKTHNKTQKLCPEGKAYNKCIMMQK